MRKAKIYLLLCTVVIMVVAGGCEQEAEREFPRVKTLEGKIINNGVVLRGEVSNLKSVELLEYGFVIGEGDFSPNKLTDTLRSRAELKTIFLKLRLSLVLRREKPISTGLMQKRQIILLSPNICILQEGRAIRLIL